MRLLRRLRPVYLVLVAAAFGWLLWRSRDELAVLLEGARIERLAAAFLLGFGMIAWSGGFWSSMVSATGHRLGFAEATVAAARSLLARYIPGGVWYAAGRVGILRRTGAPVPALTATAGMEMILSLGVAVILGIPLVALSGARPGLSVAWVPIAAGAVVLLHPAANAALGWWERRTDSTPMAVPLGGYARGVAWLVLFWVWSGTTFWVYLTAFPAVDAGAYPVVVGAFMVAWGIGFVTPIAPQGIGVVEVALALMLAGGDLAATVALVAGYRALILVRDAVATGAGELAARAPREAPRGSPPRG